MKIQLSVVHLSLAVAGFLFVTAGTLLSQEVRPEREQVRERIGESIEQGVRPERERERERVRERIEMVRVWKMTAVLDLSKEQGDRLFSPLSEIDEKRRDLFEERGSIMRELTDTARGENPDEAVLKDLLTRLERVTEALEKVGEEEVDTVKKVLSTVQQARYVVFKENFERELRSLIRDVRDRPSDARNERRPRGGESPGGF